MIYQNIIKKAKELGISECELYLQTNTGLNIDLFEGKMDSYNEKDYFGISIRGLYQGKMGYAYAENLDNIDALLHEVIKNAKNITEPQNETFYPGGSVYQTIAPQLADYNDYTNQEKVALLQTIEKTILDADSKIKKVAYCMYRENGVMTKIINSQGLNLEREISYISLFAGAIAENNNETSSGYAGDLGYKFSELEIDRIKEEVVSDAINSLNPISVASGNYPIVLRRDVATDILGSFSSLFSGDAAKKNLTLLKDKENTKIFGDNINIYDDPFFANAIVKIPFDDEGVPCKTKCLIQAGVFTTFLHNLETAQYFKTTSTGNGFKQSIASDIMVGISNLYLQAGTHERDALIASVDDGIYITSVSGLHAGVNPISGDFNVQASGYLIKDGTIGQPITLFVLSGNFIEMMNNVELIGNDLEKRFISVASPSLKIKQMKISGK